MELLSSTQGLYGFVISFMIFGQMSGTISLIEECTCIASLPSALTAIVAGRCRGRAASAAMQILAKKPEHVTKGSFIAAMETYCILGFVYFLLAGFKLRGGERCLISAINRKITADAEKKYQLVLNDAQVEIENRSVSNVLN